MMEMKAWAFVGASGIYTGISHDGIASVTVPSPGVYDIETFETFNPRFMHPGATLGSQTTGFIDASVVDGNHLRVLTWNENGDAENRGFYLKLWVDSVV